MIDLKIFLNTNIEHNQHDAPSASKGNNLSLRIGRFLEAKGNFFFTPIRLIYQGRKIHIFKITGVKDQITWTQSISKEAVKSNIDDTLVSDSPGMLNTALAIALFVPALLIGSVFKGLSFISKEQRENHSLLKTHFTPLKVEAGSQQDPITSVRNLKETISRLRTGNLLSQPLKFKIYYNPENISPERDQIELYAGDSVTWMDATQPEKLHGLSMLIEQAL